MQYREMSEQVIDHFGGVENISQVEHCTTRLRIHFVDKTKVDLDALKGIEKVISVVEAPNQIQVVIGPNVEEAFEDFLAVSGERGGIATGSVVDEDPDGAGKPRSFKDLVTIVGNACAGIFVPISPALITGGVILSIKNLLVNYLGMGVESGTAQGMLANKNFVAKAPEAKVQAERDKLDKYTQLLSQLDSRIDSLRNR